MSVDFKRSMVLTVITSVIVLISLFYLFNIVNGTGESFFSLAIVDSGKTSIDYFNGENSIVNIDEKYDWYIFAENKFDSSKQILVKVKLVDENIDPPNSTSCTPCLATPIFEKDVYLNNNESIYLPFEWSINNVEYYQETSKITDITVDDIEIPVNVLSSSNNFRFIFELWVYDSNSRDYVFKWGEENGACSWGQIWFKIAEGT